MIEFFPQKSVLWEGLSDLSVENETVIVRNLKQNINQFLKIGGRRLLVD